MKKIGMVLLLVLLGLAFCVPGFCGQKKAAAAAQGKKVCPKCKRTFVKEYKYCPYDATPLQILRAGAPGGAGKGQAGKTWTDPVTKMVFIWVPEGCFQLGCGQWSGACTQAEIPVHEVCMDGFYLGKYEVTQGQWEKVMGGNPSKFKSCGANCPVEQVSWEDVRLFILQLNNQSKIKFQLPTEAQWEYAARSLGRPEKYAGGPDLKAVGWYDHNGKNETHPVGSKAPNALGFFDMSGNVWEWCADGFYEDAYARHQKKNPVIQSRGCGRVMRGGSWNSKHRSCQTSSRGWSIPEYRHYDFGFRLVALPGK